MLTLNAARKGVSIIGQMEHFLGDFHADVVVCPEAHIPVSSAVTYRNAWRRLGYHAILSSPEGAVCKVALLSKSPCRRASLTKGEAATRHVAALVDFCGQQGAAETVLVTGVYFQAGNEAVAAGQMEDVLQASVDSGFRFVVLGDYNLVPEHGTLLEYFGTTPVVPCDACSRGAPLPATGPKVQGVRRRRIDFGLSHRQLQATAVDHCEGPSDHLIVRYDFQVAAPRLRGMPPRKTEPGRSCPPLVSSY